MIVRTLDVATTTFATESTWLTPHAPSQVVDAIKDLVQDCNFDCNDSGIALQAMDNSHVALVSMMLKAEGFSPFRCDRNIALGVNLTSLTKVLRAAQNEDILTLKAEDAPDVLNIVFESSENDRISEYDLKLMDIDQEHLGIPETEYAATISMPSAEFRRICTDLSAMSESVGIEASKDGVKFSCNGDIGNGSVTLRSHTNVEKPDLNVDIELTEPVSLTFSLKYLVNFCKAAGLSGQVKICLSSEVPLLVEYNLSGSSYLRFYLAPKVRPLLTSNLAQRLTPAFNRLVTKSKNTTPIDTCDGIKKQTAYQNTTWGRSVGRIIRRRAVWIHVIGTFTNTGHGRGIQNDELSSMGNEVHVFRWRGTTFKNLAAEGAI